MKSEKVKVPRLGTKKFVKFFEEDQKQHGTKTAIGNLLWLVAADIMGVAGVKHLSTTYKKKNASKD